MGIEPVYQRLAELRMKQKARGLTTDEQLEFDQCLDWNVRFCWSVALLLNQSLMASMTDDYEWQHEICGRLDDGNSNS